MKKIFLSLAALFFIFYSCTKSNSSNPAVPPKNDTSTLLKSEIVYALDANGNRTDSSIATWIFDNNRNITSSTFTNKQTADSSSYTYSSNQSTEYEVQYLNGSLISKSNNITYLNGKTNPDSLLQTLYSINNGSSTTYTSIIYYYYDQNGNDTLENFFNINNSLKTLGTIVRKTYSNNMLDSVIQINNNQITSLGLYANGNVLTDTEYTNGQAFLNHSYTYSNVLSGGIYFFTGTKNLMTIFTENFVQPPTSSTIETLNYTFDSINRVSTATRSKSGVAYSEEVFNYY